MRHSIQKARGSSLTRAGRGHAFVNWSPARFTLRAPLSACLLILTSSRSSSTADPRQSRSSLDGRRRVWREDPLALVGA
jgi:hypothetical protein